MATKNSYDKEKGSDKLAIEINRGAQTIIINVTFPKEPSTEAAKKYGL